MTYQIAIIGGGLAGLALAIDLRKRGHEVIVIEKGSYPRQKVCGEYISLESQNYLFSLCPQLADFNLPVIKKFLLTSTSKKEFRTTLPLGGFGISRYLLEEQLYHEACKLGVVFMLQTKASSVEHDTNNSIVTIQTTKGVVKSSLVCNSSGRKSNFETTKKEYQPPKTNYIGIKYHVKLKRDSSLIEIHNFPGGYCGISTIEEDKSCLCYIVNSKKLRAAHNSIPELERTILSQNSHLKEIFTTATFISSEPVTISGINFKIKKSTSHETFFLGDSAGSIAPITGNGMSMALRSAAVLANAIDDYFTSAISYSELQKNYAIFWKKQFSTRVKLSRQFQKLSEHPSLTNLSIRLFKLLPALAQRVIKQTHGKPF